MRTLWYLLQIIALTGGIGWLLQQGGWTSLWLGPYHLSGDSGVLLVLMLVAVILLLTFQRLVLWVMALPKMWARYRRDVRLSKGHQALVRSISALAIGDQKIAHYQAWRAQQLLPEFKALPTILLATTADRQGKYDVARQALYTLLDTEARDLGVRGLVQSALASGERDAALRIARTALSKTPRAAMLQRLVYDLECENGEFAAALARQKKLIKAKVLDSLQARHDAVVLNTALAYQAWGQKDAKAAGHFVRDALSLDNGFVPAACLHADLMIETRHYHRAGKIIQQAYKKNPHPDLADRWARLSPITGNLTKRMRWWERLLALRPDSVEAQLALARVCMRERLWGEARAYLSMAEKLAPRRAVFKALADLANQQGDGAAAQGYLIQAANAEPDPVWYCRVSGKTYGQWMPVALPHYAFGSMTWGGPEITPAAPAVSTATFETVDFRHFPTGEPIAARA